MGNEPDFRSDEYFYTFTVSNRSIEGLVISAENLDKAVRKSEQSALGVNVSSGHRSTVNEIYSAYTGRKHRLLFQVHEDIEDVNYSDSKFYMIETRSPSIDYFITGADSKPGNVLKGDITKGNWKEATSGVIHEYIVDGHAVRDISEGALMDKRGTRFTDSDMSEILEDVEREAKEQSSEWEEGEYPQYQSKVMFTIFRRHDIQPDDISEKQREEIRETISENADLKRRR